MSGIILPPANDLCISGLFLHPGRVGGTEHYFYNLLRGWPQPAQATLLLNAAYRGHYDPVVERFAVRYVPLRRSRVWYDYGLRWAVPDLRKFRAVFSPNYVTPLRWGLQGVRLVTTLHDLQYRHYPAYFSAYNRAVLRSAHFHTLRAADTVVVISEFVRQDVLARHGAHLASRLRVIPNPVDFDRLEGSLPADWTLPAQPYWLSVSALYAHKNTLTLVRAFRQFRQKHPEYSLVLTGQHPAQLLGEGATPYHRTLLAEIEQTAGVVFTGYVPDAVLGALYRHSAAFVFPSLFEGFGMPAVEAMGLGRPVLTTRCAALPEVTLGLAHYVDDPQQPAALASAMTALVGQLAAHQQKAFELAPRLRATYAPEKIARTYAETLG